MFIEDCATTEQFTHAADWMARTVVRNALFFGSGRMSSLLIPRATYTDPEVAHVGKTMEAMAAAGIQYDTYTRRFANVDRFVDAL